MVEKVLYGNDIILVKTRVNLDAFKRSNEPTGVWADWRGENPVDVYVKINNDWKSCAVQEWKKKDDLLAEKLPLFVPAMMHTQTPYTKEQIIEMLQEDSRVCGYAPRDENNLAALVCIDSDKIFEIFSKSKPFSQFEFR